MKVLHHIDLGKIKINTNNPNIHDEEKLKVLSANIKEFGLLNPINVKEVEKGLYEIIAGEGRYRAMQKLGMKKIPCTIVEDTSDYKDWGRRLSENKVRSFSWIGECIELANMKADGKEWKQLHELFGYAEQTIQKRVAIGECFKNININDFNELNKVHGDMTYSMNIENFQNYVLPLRIPPEKSESQYVEGKEGWQPVDYSKYNYSEVEKCLKLILSKKLKIEDLPIYSAETRLTILNKLDDKEINKRLEGQKIALENKLRGEYEKKIDNLNESLGEAKEKHDELLKNIKDSNNDEKTLILLKKELDESSKKLKQIKEVHNEEVKKLNKKLEILPAELEEKIKQKVKAEKQEDYEKSLKEREKGLEDREKIIKDEERRLSIVKDDYKKELDIDVWIMAINRSSVELAKELGYARRKGFWNAFDKKLVQKIASNIKNVYDEMKSMIEMLEERKLIG